MEKLIAFTDGASKGNPGPGGFGAVIVFSDHIEELGGSEKKTTNNRMEMLAGLAALQFAKEKKRPITIYTDSSYLVNGITKWVYGWQKKGWKTATGGDVQNKDIWEKMLLVSDGLNVSWKLLEGHVGVPGNERADKISSDFAEGKEVSLFKGSIRDYKINVMDFSSDPIKSSAKSVQKSRTNAKAFSYVSMVDGDIKIHKTWAECEARVKGMKGASYRKSTSGEEEKEIIAGFREKSK